MITQCWQVGRADLSLSRHDGGGGGGEEAPHFLQRVIQGRLPPGASFLPAGRARTDDGWHAAGSGAGQ